MSSMLGPLFYTSEGLLCSYEQCKRSLQIPSVLTMSCFTFAIALIGLGPLGQALGRKRENMPRALC